MDDLISRQAAIKAIEGLDIPEDMCVFEILSHIESEIATLPSAQRWIPCSERFPKEEGLYLCTVKGLLNTTHLRIAEYLHDIYKEYEIEKHKPGFVWYSEYGDYEVRVIAWMPLPKPYRKGGQDGEN